MQRQPDELAWNLLVELRKEIVSSQQIRATVIGFKITFVTGAVGLIIARLDTVPSELFVVPAFAAIFFDFLINSYSSAIKRKGIFCRAYIEPKLRQAFTWPSSEPLWEEYMSDPRNKQSLSIAGNLGITLVTCVPAVIVLGGLYETWYAIPLLVVLLCLLALDVISYLKPRWIAEMPLPGHERSVNSAPPASTTSPASSSAANASS